MKVRKATTKKSSAARLYTSCGVPPGWRMRQHEAAGEGWRPPGQPAPAIGPASTPHTTPQHCAPSSRLPAGNKQSPRPGTACCRGGRQRGAGARARARHAQARTLPPLTVRPEPALAGRCERCQQLDPPLRHALAHMYMARRIQNTPTLRRLQEWGAGRQVGPRRGRPRQARVPLLTSRPWRPCSPPGASLVEEGPHGEHPGLVDPGGLALGAGVHLSRGRRQRLRGRGRGSAAGAGAPGSARLRGSATPQLPPRGCIPAAAAVARQPPTSTLRRPCPAP